MDKHSLLTEASIEAWIAENDPGGKEKLAALLVSDGFAGDRAEAVFAYFAADADRLRVAERALDQLIVEPERRPSGVRAQRATMAARWVGQIAIVLTLLAIILMPFWST